MIILSIEINKLRSEGYFKYDKQLILFAKVALKFVAFNFFYFFDI